MSVGAGSIMGWVGERCTGWSAVPGAGPQVRLRGLIDVDCSLACGGHLAGGLQAVGPGEWGRKQRQQWSSRVMSLLPGVGVLGRAGLHGESG